MKLFNKIFKANKKKEEKKRLRKEKRELREQLAVIDTTGLPVCCACGKPIYNFELIKHFKGQKYHIQCFRSAKKNARADVVGGNIESLKFA